jgi:glucose/mannose-6-phosphate isomerase
VNHNVDRYFIVDVKLQILNISNLEKYDSQKMYKIYDEWPKIARESFESEQESIDFQNIDHVVFAGMGGSGSIGSVFSSILSKTNVHVSVVKGYILPKTVNKNTIVIATSVSGNTVETLSIINAAKKIDCKILACSSGGKIEKFCHENNIEYRKIPMTHSPRASFTSFLYSMLKILNQIIPINLEDVNESINELEKLKKKISSDNLSSDNPALELAKEISSIPLIYYPVGLESVAIRFKNSLQENSKTHAISENILEASHNGIVAWERQSNVKPILIQGQDDHLKTKERFKIFKEYFELNKIEFKEINSVHGSILSKIINLIYLLDYTTIYRAVLSNIDPSPVSSIDFIKKEIRNNS